MGGLHGDRPRPTYLAAAGSAAQRRWQCERPDDGIGVVAVAEPAGDRRPNADARPVVVEDARREAWRSSAFSAAVKVTG